MTRKGVMIANLLHIAAGKIERTKGEFIEYSREEMMHMAQYALNPINTVITDEPSEEDREILNDYLSLMDSGKILSPSRVWWIAHKLKQHMDGG